MLSPTAEPKRNRTNEISREAANVTVNGNKDDENADVNVLQFSNAPNPNTTTTSTTITNSALADITNTAGGTIETTIAETFTTTGSSSTTLPNTNSTDFTMPATNSMSTTKVSNTTTMADMLTTIGSITTSLPDSVLTTNAPNNTTMADIISTIGSSNLTMADITTSTAPESNLCKIILTMATVIQNLQDQNSTLLFKIESLENEVSEIKKIQYPLSKRRSFAEVVSKNVSKPINAPTEISASPLQSSTVMKTTEIPNKLLTRKKCIIVRNATLPANKEDDISFGRSLTAACSVAEPEAVFRITLETGPPLLKIQLKSQNDAHTVMKLFEKVKTTMEAWRDAIVRPDLSKPDLAKYRLAWKDAIKRNNEAKQRIFTVRNLEVVKIVYKEGGIPYPWIVRVDPQNLSQ
uniref:Uncharacterized protein n=1 Tax=Caenorhabditis japonica TaxID=281687 RepID=A0A8R1EQC8_CAEJA